MLKRLILVLAAAALLAAPSAALASTASNIQTQIANYEGVPSSHVHITTVNGSNLGNGRGWDCQSFWRFSGGTYFYSYNMVWDYAFSFRINGTSVQIGEATTNGQAC